MDFLFVDKDLWFKLMFAILAAELVWWCLERIFWPKKKDGQSGGNNG